MSETQDREQYALKQRLHNQHQIGLSLHMESSPYGTLLEWYYDGLRLATIVDPTPEEVRNALYVLDILHERDKKKEDK